MNLFPSLITHLAAISSIMAGCRCCAGSGEMYGVFLSFRGLDTRRNFTSHLHEALIRKGIETFMDKDLKRGDGIESSLLKNIEQSNLSIVVLSKNYAGSEWCLDELVKILECHRNWGHRVLPVFYEVDPTDVEELKGSFGDAFAKLSQKFRDTHPDRVRLWTSALRELCGFSGFVSKESRSDPELIDGIVRHVWENLMDSTHPDEFYDDGLVGIDWRARKVESLIFNNNYSSDVRVVGIWGAGGIGKTTLADKVFHRISSTFEAKYFAPNVRERLQTIAPFQLRDKIIRNVLEEEENTHIGTLYTIDLSIKRRLQRKKVLVVLDDASSSEQLEQLAKGCDWFGPGSCVIITSRDRQVLTTVCDERDIYEVEDLTDDEALYLFSIHAFKGNHPEEAYKELSRRAVSYAHRIPLAVKTLGRYLYGRDLREWECTLAKLENIPDAGLHEILRISYDALEEKDKLIFLDIACFFKGEDINRVMSFLDACGLPAKPGIWNLIDKSLISISPDGKLEIHDLLQRMGKDIVMKESRYPEMRSRLWDPNDICYILTENLGTPATEGIFLDMSKIKDIGLSPQVFENMRKLSILKLWNPCSDRTRVHLRNGLKVLPNQLRLFHWDQYPLPSLPRNFCPENLVELHMSHSHLKQLFSSIPKELENLKFVDLSYSLDLTTISGLYRAANLEFLNLEGCINLTEIPPLRYLEKLTHLNINECKSLTHFPSCFYSDNLKVFCVKNCEMFTMLPKLPQRSTHLELSGTGIEQVPSSIGCLSQLVELRLEHCTKLSVLPEGIGKLICLEKLDLTGCSKLDGLPEGICNLQSLEILRIEGCSSLNGLPENIGNLKSLKQLYAANSGIKTLPSSILQLHKLEFLDFTRCQCSVLPGFTGWTRVSKLVLSYYGIFQIPSSLGSLSSVIELYLDGNNFESLPESIKNLSKLAVLCLRDCKMLRHLPELPSGVEHFDARNCTSLKSIARLFTGVQKEYKAFQEWFDFCNCMDLVQTSCSKIMDDALLRIQCTATSLVDQGSSCEESDENLESDDIKRSDEDGGVSYGYLSNFCIPGVEIPHWFTYENNGSSIELSTWPDSFNRYLGFIFCAVVVCDSFESCIFDVGCTCRFITNTGHINEVDSYYRFNRANIKDCDTPFQSKHIFMWYDSGVYRSACSTHKASFKFHPFHRKNTSDHRCCVMKCGIHLLFRQNENQHHEEERLCKRLRLNNHGFISV